MLPEMVDWWTFVLTSIPDFLMSEPICYVFGLILLVLVANLLKQFKHF